MQFNPQKYKPLNLHYKKNKNKTRIEKISENKSKMNLQRPLK